MMLRFHRNCSGTAAIEFAIICPVLLVLAVALLEIGLAFWTWNTLQDIAKTAARCAAVGSPLCATVPSGCNSSDAGICYVLQLTSNFQLVNVQTSDISIDRAATVDSVSFTTITINTSYVVLGTSFPMSVIASFPNN